MTELEQAKLLAAALKLARKEIDQVRVEFEEQFLEFTRTNLVEGLQGPQGPKGEKGEQGPAGPERRIVVEARGPVGPQGETGEAGRSVDKAYIHEDNLFIQFDSGDEIQVGKVVGPRGGQGIQGERGLIGEQGEVGPRGEKGERGDIGPRGERGEKGEKGDIGPRGIPGEKGEKGERGEKGETGEQGPVGPQGDKGERGERGVRGEKGLQGDVGPQGPAGRDGTEVDLADLKKQVEDDLSKFKIEIEAQVTRAKMQAHASGGGGAVQLRELTDVDVRTNLSNEKVLKYNSSTGKFDLGDASPNISVSNTSGEIGANVSNFVFTGSIDASGNNTHVTIDVPIQEVALATAKAGENLRLNFPKSANVVANDAYTAVALDNIGHEVSADCTNSEHVSRVVGLKVANGDVVSTGIVENSGWSWASNTTIYIGSGTTPPGANNLTDLPSVGGAYFSLPIGIALSPTKVFVRVGTSVVLGS